MSKRQLLCIVGVWIMFFLFLGFPASWHKIFAIISGLIVIAIAYNLSPGEINKEKEVSPPSSGDSFVENK